jgi:hypothetical protein
MAGFARQANWALIGRSCQTMDTSLSENLVATGERADREYEQMVSDLDSAGLAQLDVCYRFTQSGNRDR